MLDIVTVAAQAYCGATCMRHVACALGAIHPHERLAGGAINGHQAVVAEKQHIVVGEGCGDSVTLARLGFDTAIFLVAGTRRHVQRVLGQRLQAFLLGADAGSRLGMGMDRKIDLGSGCQDGTMNV